MASLFQALLAVRSGVYGEAVALQDHPGEVQVGGVVLDHQDAVALARAGPERELDDESGPLVGGAIEFDRALVQLDQLLGQGQSEPGARRLAGIRALSQE